MSDNDTIAWGRIMEQVETSESDLPVTLYENLEKLIVSREELGKKLKSFSEDMRAQEYKICLAKSACTAITMMGTALTSTPYFTLGVGITLCSSLGLDVINLQDLLAEKEKNGALDEMLKRDEALVKLFINDMKQIEALSEAFLNQKLVTSKEEGCGIAIAITLLASLSLGTKALSMTTMLRKSQDDYLCIDDGYRYGLHLWYEGVITTWQMFGNVDKKAVFIAGIAIADCIISWRSKKSCRATAEKVMREIDDGMQHLTALKNAIDNLN
jgi:hypothetical protein